MKQYQIGKIVFAKLAQFKRMGLIESENFRTLKKRLNKTRTKNLGGNSEVGMKAGIAVVLISVARMVLLRYHLEWWSGIAMIVELIGIIILIEDVIEKSKDAKK